MPQTKEKTTAKIMDGFTKEICLEWYQQMMMMRRFEEKAGQMYGQQKIRGFCHLYIGQEAVVAGMMTAIKKGDKVITAYRDHAHAIAMGITPREVMAELYGKSTGCSKGKGGSMHMFSKEHGFFGGHGIVGAQIPMGAGIAFAEKYKGTDNIAICFMGDGAVRQGALHETFTMAMLWELPVIFVCENNKYGMGTAVERTTNVPYLYKIASAYDMPAAQVDGMDCLAVHNAFAEAADRARNEKIPTFLEINTYRYKGHSMSDPAKYRSKEEVEEFRHRDPIDAIANIIKQKDFATEEELTKIEDDIKLVVEDSVKFAEESPYPDASEIYKDIYTQADYPYLMD
ncbi:MAG: pyruvate dehydrogenase (acetyl-transferring) E1 component subunit alpha [Bacteroidetes bacterium]|nr:pyruvate dehydrogenase (acetyl-transferring) E1 component subunit alpha [Bacteroidota bacterium]